MTRTLEMLVANGAHAPGRVGPGGRGHWASPDRGLAAVADAIAGHDFSPADRCASLALQAIDARDRVVVEGEPVLSRGVDSPASVVASVAAANERIATVIRDEFPQQGAVTSLATVLLDERGTAFVAWAGFRVRLHRLRAGRCELLTPSSLNTGGDARLGTLVRYRETVYAFGGDLGQQPCPPILTNSVQLGAGDLLVLSGGWSEDPPEGEQHGRELLECLSRQSLEVALTDCLRRRAWARYLPAVLLRFKG